MPFDAANTRPAIEVHDDGQSRVIVIDTQQEAGRAALERWSYIDPAERAKWAKPWVFHCAEMEGFYAGSSK